MAHASTTDAAKQHKKKLKEKREIENQKETELLANMSAEERAVFLKNKNSRTLRNQCASIIWDLKKHQLCHADAKFHIRALEGRIQEIGNKPNPQLFAKEDVELKKALDKIKYNY